MDRRPLIAIVDNNRLTVIGLKTILKSVMPAVEFSMFSSCDELIGSGADNYFHYFVSTRVVLNNMSFFESKRNKTIVLTTSESAGALAGKFHCINVDVSEEQLIKSLLMLEQHAHAHGKNLPPAVHVQNACPLTPREIEVMTLIVKGFINKEIADRLNISLPTVITHRKNINDKLHTRSVSALTIYAVMHGYVDINNI